MIIFGFEIKKYKPIQVLSINKALEENKKAADIIRTLKFGGLGDIFECNLLLIIDLLLDIREGAIKAGFKYHDSSILLLIDTLKSSLNSIQQIYNDIETSLPLHSVTIKEFIEYLQTLDPRQKVFYRSSSGEISDILRKISRFRE